MNELVSIITPSYNCSKYIAQTIESVLAQTYQNWEMIIVDDCSKDNSIEIIESYTKKDSRIKLYILEKNSGAAIARNKAIELANGRFIAFLDSDDLWLPNKLKKQINFMVDKNLALSYTAYKKIDENGIEGTKIINVPENASYGTLLNTNYIACLTGIYDVNICGKHFMPDISHRQDYGLWLNILKKIGHEDYGFWLGILKKFSSSSSSSSSAGGLNEPLALYRVHSNSLSSNKLKAAFYHWLVLRKIEKLPFFKSVYHFIQYGYHGIRKHNKF